MQYFNILIFYYCLGRLKQNYIYFLYETLCTLVKKYKTCIKPKNIFNINKKKSLFYFTFSVFELYFFLTNFVYNDLFMRYQISFLMKCCITSLSVFNNEFYFSNNIYNSFELIKFQL